MGAENICRQLGYAGGSKYTAGGGTGPIHAGNRRCSGGEKTVFDCPLKRAEFTDCSHSIDQGVHCTDAACPNGWLRFGQNCYKSVSQSVSWNDAESSCNDEGGNLASVHSAE